MGFAVCGFRSAGEDAARFHLPLVDVMSPGRIA